MRNIWVASLWWLLCCGWCLAQNSGDTLTPERSRPSHPSDLMARSEMQAPRSIPITRRLRFEEIPVEVPGQTIVRDNGPSVVVQQNNLNTQPQNGSAVPSPGEKSADVVTLTATPTTTGPSTDAGVSTDNPPQR